MTNIKRLVLGTKMYVLSSIIIFKLFGIDIINAQGILGINDGGTGVSLLTAGSVLFMGTSTISQNTSNLFWDDTNKRLGIGTSSPLQALELGVNKSIQLSTDENTQNVTGLIRLQSLTDEAKAIIAYLDKSGKEVIWLQTHDYLTYPTNKHKHFSIEASDAKGLKQTRLSIGYGANVVDVTVNQANLIVNRNNGMVNGNIIMTGGGGGGTFKHANSFSFYPSYASNSANALQLSIQTNNQVTLRALGSDILYIDDSLKLNGNVGIGVLPTASLQLRAGSSMSGSAPFKFTAGSLLTIPENGALEYDGSNLYFTTDSDRKQISSSIGDIIHRTSVSDADYIIQESDELIAYTSLTTNRTVTLPFPESMINRVLIIKDESGVAGANAIIVEGLIDGGMNNAIDSDYGFIEIYSSGSAWFTK